MPRGGQVHRAVLWDGREVAVKVQYLGLETAVSADLACLGALAAAAARLFPAAPDLRWVLAELRSNLAQELDFRRAARALHGTTVQVSIYMVCCWHCLRCPHFRPLHLNWCLIDFYHGL